MEGNSVEGTLVGFNAVGVVGKIVGLDVTALVGLYVKPEIVGKIVGANVGEEYAASSGERIKKRKSCMTE